MNYTMPYPATLIALAFVKKGILEGKFVTQMKLQKMIYFAHGYHLAKYNQPLIKENFEAWQFGPVVPRIYSEYKFYGSKPIADMEWIEWLNPPQEKDLNSLDTHAQEAINYTWTAVKDVSAVQLSNWTHRPDAPWSRHYVAGIQDIAIPNDDIKHYFSNFLELTDAA